MAGINLTGDMAHKIIHLALDPAKPSKEQPALFLYRPGHLGRSAIIPLESAWKYDEPESRDDQMAVLLACRNIAVALDYPTDESTLSHIAFYIQDHLDDLVHAPAAPQRERQVVGEITGNLNGKTFRQDLLN
jgi:hypothetical protein